MLVVDSSSQDAAPALSGHRALRLVELLGVFFLAPLALYFVFDWLPPRFIMVALLIAAIWALLVLRKHNPPYDQLGLGRAGMRNFLPVLFAGGIVWIIAAAIAGAIRWRQGLPIAPAVTDEPLFTLAFVPIYGASASAQELVFRSFFFWRYRGVLPLGVLAILNIVSFGWMHVVFHSSITVWLSMAGGVLFTMLYLWRRSLVGSITIHTMFGLAVFAMGLGHYFMSRKI